MNKRSIVRAFILNKPVIYFAVVMIFIAGLYAYNEIPKQEYPDTTMPGSYIKIIYPGATPKELEELVIKNLEERIMEIDDYYYSKSMIYNSMALTLLVFDPALAEEEIEKRWDELDEIIEDIRPSLPNGVNDIVVDNDLMEIGFVF